MMYSTLVDVEEAHRHLLDAGWVFVDCRASLGMPAWGEEQYRAGHIPGAVYADLAVDLAGPVEPGRTGRHPLPSPERFDAFVSSIGIDENTQVVTYDESTGSMAGARLWWLLRWAGHDAVAVLNGGFTHWKSANYAVATGDEQRTATHFVGNYETSLVARSDEILASLPGGDLRLVDVRAGQRYRGEVEPIDPVAGHIPGAVSVPFDGNLSSQDLFRSATELRSHFSEALGASEPETTVFYCGSGVTAAHSALAYAHAGLGMPRLYPGSWSEWITDPERPVA